MEDVYLKYDENIDTPSLELFYEYQNIIRKDLKRIRYLVSDYDSSEEKITLLSNLNITINNICNNRFPDDPLMQLEIQVKGNYLCFSYFKLDEDGYPLTSQPTFVIITREMRNLYFIDKVCTLIRNKESDRVALDNPYEDYCRYTVDCYQLKKKEITKNSTTFEGCIPVYDCFHKTDKLIEKIKSKF